MAANIDPRAGHLADPKSLIDVSRLVTAYFANKPDVGVVSQRVAFGTSGHRGSAFDTAFNENHILAIAQAICNYRRAKGTDGPLFVGADPHALSAPALTSALEVFAANDVTVMIDECMGYTPTPVVSRAILFVYTHRAYRLRRIPQPHVRFRPRVRERGTRTLREAVEDLRHVAVARAIGHVLARRQVMVADDDVDAQVGCAGDGRVVAHADVAGDDDARGVHYILVSTNASSRKRRNHNSVSSSALLSRMAANARCRRTSSVLS